MSFLAILLSQLGGLLFVYLSIKLNGMLKKFSITFFVAALVGLSSCETDFSLNGEYELTPVVFGLLDQNDSIHMIKITKVFLGDGNYLEYAQNPDSNYFKQVEAQIIELNEEGDEQRRWDLKDTIITGKSTDGVFYSPDQKVYYFEANDLVETFTYRLVADLNEGQKSISSQTSLIYNFTLPNTISTAAAKLAFAKNTVTEDKDYTNMSISIPNVINAGNNEIGYTMHWTEHYLDGSSASFSKRKYESKSDNPSASIIINGLNFYKWVQVTVPDDENVDYRTMDGIDIHFAYGHDVLKQYMDVSAPVTGVAQIQPFFTNIDGGYGLFSSRFQYTRFALPLNTASAKELREGSYTYTKKFL